MATAARALPCLHLGPVAERAHCNCRRRDRRACGLGHGGGTVVPYADCEACADYAPDAGRADLLGPAGVELLPGLFDPLPDPVDPRRKAGWAKAPDTVYRHREALKAVLAQDPPYPGGSGAGVVTCGGGPAYWPMICLQLRMLRKVGCTLPVEVWHRGDKEPVRAADVAGLGDVEIVDLAATAEMNGDQRVDGGFESKSYAVCHSRFDTILFCDADAYCVSDPTPLLDATKVHGVVWYKDLPHQGATLNYPLIWPDVPRLPGGQVAVGPIQGGQWAVHRPTAWKMLTLFHWISQHSDWAWHHMYGDQDALRLAMLLTGSFGKCLGPAEWRPPAFVCRYNNVPVIVHRCGQKLGAHTHLPLEADVWREFAAVVGTP